jgi:hypothetical protein
MRTVEPYSSAATALPRRKLSRVVFAACWSWEVSERVWDLALAFAKLLAVIKG